MDLKDAIRAALDETDAVAALSQLLAGEEGTEASPADVAAFRDAAYDEYKAAEEAAETDSDVDKVGALHAAVLAADKVLAAAAAPPAAPADDPQTVKDRLSALPELNTRPEDTTPATAPTPENAPAKTEPVPAPGDTGLATATTALARVAETLNDTLATLKTSPAITGGGDPAKFQRKDDGDDKDTSVQFGTAPNSSARITASAGVAEAPMSSELSPETFAEVVASMSHRMQTGGTSRHPIGSFPIRRRPGVVFAYDPVTGKENASALDPVSQATAELSLARKEDNRVVASGGVCVAPEPDFSIDVVGGAGSCWSSKIPTIVSNRPVAFHKALEFDVTKAGGGDTEVGIGEVTPEQDAAGYGAGTEADPIPEGGAKFKECVRVPCGDLLTCKMIETYRCVTVGNFQAITHPEIVAAFDKLVRSYFEYRRDMRIAQRLLQVISDNASWYGDAGTGDLGAGRTLPDVIMRMAALIRNAAGDPTMELDFYVSGYAGQLVSADLMKSLDWGGNGSFMKTGSAGTDIGFALLAMDQNINILPGCVPIAGNVLCDDVVTPVADPAGEYGWIAPGGTCLPDASVALPGWPQTVRVMAMPAGNVFSVNHGKVEVGMTEVGVGTNDQAYFQAIIESFCDRGSSHTMGVDVTVCVNGVAGGTQVVACEPVPVGEHGKHQGIPSAPAPEKELVTA